ncbi:hypothetical protein C0991_003468 [Blastosporella zonata]|nr:hypothetical protein C0991_003468 [Blastosporella zonata]
MPRRKQFYSIFSPPSLSMSELVKTTLDHDETDLLIDQWLDHRGHGQLAYHEWFRDIRERKHAAQSQKKQVIAWNKGEFAPENVFCRTVDTGRLIPLDRTWTTHVYHHRSFQDRGLPMKPVVFTMIDLAVRAILHEKQPRFLVLFSHHGTSYSQIFFTHPSYVPDEDIYYDLPTGCPNPCCNDDCEMIRFPRRGLETASILNIWTNRRRRVKTRPMCNWIDCDVVFCDVVGSMSSASSNEGSEISVGSSSSGEGRIPGQTCSKCKLVKYCSTEHQRKDWEEHRRVCVKPIVLDQ